MPKRMRRICSSRGVSVASTLRVCSPRLPWIAASTGEGASSSSTKSPSELSSSSPICVFERERLFDDLEYLLDLVQRHLHLLGDFLGPRFATEPLHEQARHAQQLVDGLNHVHRDTDGTALVGNGTRHRLANPPRRVSRKLVAALIF